MLETNGTPLDGLGALWRRYGETYRAGEALFHQDDRGAVLFVVLSGTVDITRRDPETGMRWSLRSVGAGAIVGETSCFSSQPHSATAVAREDTRVVRLGQAAALELVRTCPDFAVRLILSLGDRVRDTTAQIGSALAVTGVAPSATPLAGATGRAALAVAAA